MRKLEKGLIVMGIGFIVFVGLGMLASTYYPTPEEPKKVVKVEKPKPKPKAPVPKPKPKVKKKKKKKATVLKLEPIETIQTGNLIVQCYATNQSSKNWKGSVSVKLYRKDGSILYSSARHVWLDIKLQPDERDYLVAKIPKPYEKHFTIKWEWGNQSISVNY